jgi:hypothetical protein
MTGHIGVHTEEQLLSMGAEYVFEKPFSLLEVAAKLTEILR